MVASSWPFLTICPSLNSTWVMTPETCGRTVTVTTGVTVPSASRTTGRSACVATATPTALGGAPRAPRPPPPGPPAPAPPPPVPAPGPPGPPRSAPDAPDAAANAPPIPGAASGGRCVRYQARAARPINVASAIAAPSPRRPADSGGRGGGGGGRASVGEG